MSKRYQSYGDEPETEEEAFRGIEDDVDRIWRSKWWSEDIRDDESQRGLIKAMQQKYIYPDYLELVGPPGPDDYRSDGCLTTSRKAELLLIGTFNWQGLTIAKHPSVFGYVFDRWEMSRSPCWRVDDKGWYVCHEDLPSELTYDGFLTPFKDRPVQKLGDYLVNQVEPLKDLHGTIPIDGNVYNCQQDNLRVINLRGRPMRCKGCERRVAKEYSRLIRFDGVRERYCHACIEQMANWKEIKQLW